MSDKLEGTSTGGGGRDSSRGRPQTGQQPNPKRSQLEEKDSERTVENSGGEGEESRREPLHEITLIKQFFREELHEQRADFMNKLEKQSMALNTATMEKEHYKGRFYHETGLLKIVPLIDHFYNTYRNRHFPSPKIREHLEKRSRQYLIGYFFSARQGTFRRTLDELTTGGKRFEKDEVVECIEQLQLTRNEVAHPDHKYYSNYELVLPEEYFTERQFIVMRTVCTLLGVRCVRMPEPFVIPLCG